MVNNVGQWIPCRSIEKYDAFDKEKWCIMDYIAYALLKRIKETDYKIKTSLENMACLFLNTWESESENAAKFEAVNEIDSMIYDLGPLSNWDYKC